jgi:hypothetical protein
MLEQSKHYFHTAADVLGLTDKVNRPRQLVLALKCTQKKAPVN